MVTSTSIKQNNYNNTKPKDNSFHKIRNNTGAKKHRPLSLKLSKKGLSQAARANCGENKSSKKTKQERTKKQVWSVGPPRLTGHKAFAAVNGWFRWKRRRITRRSRTTLEKRGVGAQPPHSQESLNRRRRGLGGQTSHVSTEESNPSLLDFIIIWFYCCCRCNVDEVVVIDEIGVNDFFSSSWCLSNWCCWF